MVSMYPLNGPVFGGTDVEVRGVDVHTADVKGVYCKFGVRETVVAEVQGAHVITCTTPSYAEAVVVDVHIFNNEAIYSSSMAFFYEEDVIVNMMYPLVGLESGGTIYRGQF